MSSGARAWGAIGLVIAILCLCIWQIPILKRDQLISQDYRVVTDDVWVDGRCMSKYRIVTACIGKVTTYRLNQTNIDRFAIFYIGEGQNSRYFDVVRAADDFEAVTILPAIEAIESRRYTFWGIVFLLSVLCLREVINFRSSTRVERATRRPDPLQLVTVERTAQMKSTFGKDVDYGYVDEVGDYHSASSTFRSGETPFELSNGEFLAVLPLGSDLPIMLNRDLSRLDLTRAERRAVKAAFSGPSFFQKLLS